MKHLLRPLLIFALLFASPLAAFSGEKNVEQGTEKPNQSTPSNECE